LVLAAHTAWIGDIDFHFLPCIVLWMSWYRFDLVVSRLFTPSLIKKLIHVQ
jgi:hypothetical protein